MRRIDWSMPTLCLDRAFVEQAKDGAFARDIAGSFLRWALPGEALARLGDFLAELGDPGPNVIRLAGVPRPALPAQPTAPYRVYLGRDKDCDLALPGMVLRLTNLQARDAPRDPAHDWIWFRAYLR